MSDWPEIETRILRDGDIVNNDIANSDGITNLLIEDRIAIHASARINGRNVNAVVLCASGLHHDVDEATLLAIAEPGLREELQGEDQP